VATNNGKTRQRKAKSSGGDNRPKLKDIAEACGVSVGTVSRVLNGDQAFSVREAVRDNILATAEQLGYAPDLAARTLKSGRTQIIGVFGSPDTHVSEGINDAIFAGITEAVMGFNYDVFFELTSHHTRDRPLPLWRFDGAILLQSPQPSLVEAIQSRRVPYVAVNEIEGSPAASVVSDDEGGATLALHHLAQLGHETLAYANVRSGYFPHYSNTERHDTIVSFCKAHRIRLADGHDDFFTTADAFIKRAILDGGATAVIAYDHHIAIEILGAAQRLGLRIPHDFSLTCFNDEFPAAQVFPPLTVVAVSGQYMGREAARLLMRAIDRSQPPRRKTERVRIPERLIVRESTGPPPSERDTDGSDTQ